MNNQHPWMPKLAAGAIGACMLLGAALAETTGAGATNAQARYQQEMARCNSGQSQQDAATCRREATNALAEARRGGLTSTAPEQYTSNAMQRCTSLPVDQRAECTARMAEGSTQGSVNAGGVLREHITVVPVPAQ